MSIAAEWAGSPKCWCCGAPQLVDYGTDFLGRVWCFSCAQVADALRRRGPVAA